jgi:glycosyltransferase involved in cell wall biosynthesis
VIDDGSKDETANIVKSIQDERLTLFQNEKNLGLIATLNRGLELSRGEYVARMDHDDIALRDRFEKQSRFLDLHPEIAVLGGAYETIEPHPRISNHPLTPETIKEELLFTGCIIAHPTIMMRAEVLRKLEVRYDKNYPHAEDYALWALLSTKVKLANLPDVVLKYRCHSHQMSVRFGSTQELGSWKVRAMLLSQLVPPEKEKQSFENLITFFTTKSANENLLKDIAIILRELVSTNRKIQIYDPKRLENLLIIYWQRLWEVSEAHSLKSYLHFFPLRKKSFGNLLRNMRKGHAIKNAFKKAANLGNLSLIRIKISGNLGDQLFLYALSIHLHQLNAESIGFDYEEFRHFHRYQKIANLLAIKLKNEWGSPFSTPVQVLRGIFLKVFFKNITLSEDTTSKTQKRPAFHIENYRGHFRDEKFFAPSRELILKRFDFTESVQQSGLTEVAHKIQNSESVGLHLVKAEWWLQNKANPHSPTNWPSQSAENYLRPKIKIFQEQYPEASFFVFTDDANWCGNIFPETKNMIFVKGFTEENPAFLQLLKLCDHQVLSENSFGWWARWLKQ